MIAPSFGNISTVLCIGAHADDIEIGCGGVILKWLEQHKHLTIYWVVLSATGDRKQEAQASAEQFLGKAMVKSIRVTQFHDTFFPYSGKDIKLYFNDLGQEIAPDIIFTHRLEDRHQDHRLVSELTWNTFRDHLILEYEIPKYEGDLGSPNIYVPLTESICQRKVGTIVESFATQHCKHWFSAETFWALLRLRGIEASMQSQFAEGFYCRKMII